MSEDKAPVVQENDEPQLVDRNTLRQRLIGETPAYESKIVGLFGMKVEVRQPTFDAIINAREIDDARQRSVSMIIKYCYVPDTDELIFNEMDFEAILKWPWGKDMTALQTAITDLTHLDIGGAEEKLAEDPS